MDVLTGGGASPTNRRRAGSPYYEKTDTTSPFTVRYTVKSAVIEGKEHHRATGHAVSVPKFRMKQGANKRRIIESVEEQSSNDADERQRMTNGMLMIDDGAADPAIRRNLVLVSTDGSAAWRACPAEGTSDRWTEARFEGDRVIALSISGFQVTFDGATGAELSRVCLT
jgi:hypothetical protein